MRFLPKTLGGQLLALLIVALIASQAASFLLLTGDRANAVREADRSGLLEGVASVMRVLALAPPASRKASATAATSPRIRYWVSPDAAIPDPRSSEGRVIPAIALERVFGTKLREPPRLAFVDRDGEPVDRPSDPHGGQGPMWQRDRLDVIVSVPFSDAGWLNAQTAIRASPVPWPWPSMISTAIMALAILVIVGLTARRATRPLVALAETADAFGRGAASNPLPAKGPDEVRRLTAAFNRMQERLARFIGDRTRMLAAIGHDLRTPITSLKLRAELLDDEEARQKMLATLDEMQRMTEATLAFARDDAAAEPARSVDLAALIDSLVDDLAEMGKDVTFASAGRVAYSCRPTALRRAITNLVENAIAHGTHARVALSESPNGPVITIDDDGPGIPEDQLEEVFKPFVRLETSRSRETGGAGLGLAIARSIVLAHGGELTLANRPGGGLRAEIRLPKIEG